jgi:hypothetical protein
MQGTTSAAPSRRSNWDARRFSAARVAGDGHSMRTLARTLAAAACLAIAGCNDATSSSLPARPAPSTSPAQPWNPVVGERYPDLRLVDHTGAERRLSELDGRVLLIEPVGMT